MSVALYVHPHSYKHTQAHIGMHSPACASWTCTHAHTPTLIHVQTHTHVHTHRYTHSCSHTQTHTHTPASSQLNNHRLVGPRRVKCHHDCEVPCHGQLTTLPSILFVFQGKGCSSSLLLSSMTSTVTYNHVNLFTWEPSLPFTVFY